jgi:hypothetical protein
MQGHQISPLDTIKSIKKDSRKLKAGELEGKKQLLRGEALAEVLLVPHPPTERP